MASSIINSSQTTMKKAERVRAALNHKEPDKLPIDCGSMRSTGIMGIPYNALKRYLGKNEETTKIYDMVQQLAVPEQWYLDMFQIDSVDLARAFADEPDEPDEWLAWNLPDGSPALRPKWVDIQMEGDTWICRNSEGVSLGKMSPGLVYFTQTNYPLMQNDSLDISRVPEYVGKTIWGAVTDPAWQHAGKEDFGARLREKSLKLRRETDYAQMFAIGGNFFEMGQFLYRTDEFLMKLALEPVEMGKLLDKLLEMHLASLDQVIDAVGDTVDVFMFGDDFGTQSSTMISRDMYKDLIFPRQKKLFQHVHDRCDVKVFLHSCGSIYSLIPDLIDAGVDILNPVQIGAANMDPQKLKSEFGKDLTFWGGGIDTQHVLANSSPQKIRDEVRRNSEILMKDGGFVFNQVHNIVDGVAPENIIAMYEAANEIRY